MTLVVVLLMMSAVGYVFSSIMATKQKLRPLAIHTTRAFYVAQSGVEFALQYAQDQSWCTSSDLNGLDGMSRSLGGGSFTLDYDDAVDELASTGTVSLAQRTIKLHNVCDWVVGLVIDSGEPAPCTKGKKIIEFYMENPCSCSITVDYFYFTWTQTPPDEYLKKIEVKYGGNDGEWSGTYYSGDPATEFDVGKHPRMDASTTGIFFKLEFESPMTNPGDFYLVLTNSEGRGHVIDLGDLPPCP